MEESFSFVAVLLGFGIGIVLMVALCMLLRFWGQGMTKPGEHHRGHLARLGFGHPPYITNLDEFQVWEIEKAFREAFGDHSDLEEMLRDFLACLNPYKQKSREDNK